MAKQSQVKSKRKLLNPVFHLQTKQEDDSQLTKGMIKVVRKTGQLNLSGRNLFTVPAKMFTMYDLDQQEEVVSYDLGKPPDDPWWSFSPLTYLDLSSNVLQEIPKDIKMFEDLTVLNLQDNNITTLPPEIGSLKKLTKINLSHNNIKLLPNEFFKLLELQTLLMSHNNLEMISQDISDLVMLHQLDLSYNQLTQLPPGLGFLIRLTDINLSHNHLTELPPDIVNLRVLVKFDIAHNNIKRLPSMGELRKLQFLFAQNNDIEDLPCFEGCEHITQLHIGNNILKEITKDVCEGLATLKILDLSNNKISSLPKEIAMLQHIIRLDLSNNELTNLPNTMALLPRLQNLQIGGNLLKNIRQDIIRAGTSTILKHLYAKLEGESLDVSPSTPEKMFSADFVFPNKYVMRNTRSLSLCGKDLAHVPDSVFEDALAAEIGTVDLSKNKFTAVPDGMQLLAKNITELNLSTNRLSTVHDFVSTFSKLRYLDLGNNMLNDLPEGISLLLYLRELVISNNRFTTVPNCVYHLEGLEILLASDNQLSEINMNGLVNLRRLATLDLSNNSITIVPPELGKMKQLNHLELKGNPFRQPRYAILEQGTEAVLSYLRDRIPK